MIDQVYAGNAGPFVYGCIVYETSDGSTMGLVVGVTVGVVVVVILLVVVVLLLCCLCRRRRRHTDMQTPVADDAIKMSSVFAAAEP